MGLAPTTVTGSGWTEPTSRRDMLTIILLTIAAILFALAALNVPSSRVSLLAAGLFFWVLASLLPLLFH
jgi:hypothetical protein